MVYYKNVFLLIDKSFYLGILDLVEEGRWEYFLIYEFIMFNLFYLGEFCCYLSQNCLIMWELFYGDWGDIICFDFYYYVCEVENGQVYYNFRIVVLCGVFFMENKLMGLFVIMIMQFCV